MKLRRNNEYMFQVVECNTYMKRIKDGKYIRHSEQYSDVYYYVDENAEEKERKVEPEEIMDGYTLITMMQYIELTEERVSSHGKADGFEPKDVQGN